MIELTTPNCEGESPTCRVVMQCANHSSSERQNSIVILLMNDNGRYFTFYCLIYYFLFIEGLVSLTELCSLIYISIYFYFAKEGSDDLQSMTFYLMETFSIIGYNID